MGRHSSYFLHPGEAIDHFDLVQMAVDAVIKLVQPDKAHHQDREHDGQFIAVCPFWHYRLHVLQEGALIYFCPTHT